MKKHLLLGSFLITAGTLIGSDPLMDLNNSLSKLTTITPPTLGSLPNPTYPPVAPTAPTIHAALSNSGQSYLGSKTYVAATMAVATALYLSQTKFKKFYTPLVSLSELTTDQNDIEWYAITLENIKTLNRVTAHGNNVKDLLEQITDALSDNHQRTQPMYRCSGLVKIKGRIGTRKLLEKHFTCVNADSITAKFIEPFIRASYTTIHDIDEALKINATYFITISCQDFKHCYLPSKTVSANSYQELMEEFFLLLKTYIKPDTQYALKLQISLDSPAAGKRLFVTPSDNLVLEGNRVLTQAHYDKRHGYDGTQINFWTGQGYLTHRQYLSRSQGVALQSFWNASESLQSYTGYVWNNDKLVPHVRNDQTIDHGDNSHNTSEPCSSSSVPNNFEIKLAAVSRIVDQSSTAMQEQLAHLYIEKNALVKVLDTLSCAEDQTMLQQRMKELNGQIEMLAQFLGMVNTIYDLEGDYKEQ